MAAPVVAGTVALMLQANPNADAEPGQGDPPVHRAGVPGLQRADAGRRLPEHEGRRRAGAVLHAPRKPGAALSVGQAVEQDASSGATTGSRKGVIKPNAHRVEARRGVGRGRRRRGRQHRVGHATAATSATTSSGAPTAATDDDATTSCGAPSAADDGDNIVWGTFATHERQHRVGHVGRRSDNIVWGTDCGGADCDERRVGHARSTTRRADNIVWGTAS